uniref:Uncharacterized protein n=1 Tax=Acrobeloides nanus TaxID=290746 RepID=A0A914DFG7_9BILA
PGADAAYCPCPPRTGEASVVAHPEAAGGYEGAAAPAAATSAPATPSGYRRRW